MAEGLVYEYDISISRACRIMDIYRSYFYYRSRKDDAPIEEAIRLAAEYGDGFDKIYQRIRRAGHTWNHKKVYRVYRKLHFNKRVRLKRRLPVRVKNPLEEPEMPNTTWSLDFVSDRTESGRTFRVLNIIDDCNREAVAQEAYMSMPAERVISVLEEVISCNGKPECIRTDNGPEFISEKLKVWCLANGIEHKFMQPGKPTQNSYIERFNGSYRRAVLDAYIFRNLDEVRFLTEKWRADYNNNRPHEALGNMTPIEYKQFILNKNTNFDVNLCAV